MELKQFRYINRFLTQSALSFQQANDRSISCIAQSNLSSCYHAKRNGRRYSWLRTYNNSHKYFFTPKQTMKSMTLRLTFTTTRLRKLRRSSAQLNLFSNYRCNYGWCSLRSLSAGSFIGPSPTPGAVAYSSRTKPFSSPLLTRPLHNPLRERDRPLWKGRPIAAPTQPQSKTLTNTTPPNYLPMFYFSSQC